MVTHGTSIKGRPGPALWRATNSRSD